MVAATTKDLAFELMHTGLLSAEHECLGIDRQRIRAHPSLMALEDDAAVLFVNLGLGQQLATAKQEVALVGMGVKADDVVGEHAAVNLIADSIGQHAPGVGLGPRDVNEVVKEHIRTRGSD